MKSSLMFTAVIVTSNLFDCVFSRPALERLKTYKVIEIKKANLEQQSSVSWQYYNDII